MQRLWFAFAFCLAGALAMYLFTPRGVAWERYDRGIGLNATFPEPPEKFDRKLSDGGTQAELSVIRGPAAAAESGRPSTSDRNQVFCLRVATFPEEKFAVKFEDAQLVFNDADAKVTTLEGGWHQISQPGAVTLFLRRGRTVYQVDASGRLTPLELRTFLDSVEVAP